MYHQRTCCFSSYLSSTAIIAKLFQLTELICHLYECMYMYFPIVVHHMHVYVLACMHVARQHTVDDVSQLASQTNEYVQMSLLWLFFITLLPTAISWRHKKVGLMCHWYLSICCFVICGSTNVNSRDISEGLFIQLRAALKTPHTDAFAL